MALAFFTAPITSLGSFGFGKPTDSSNARPESMSAGAVIKCSDCGGDVVLAELGEHVCNPSNPAIDEEENEVINQSSPSTEPEKTSDTEISHTLVDNSKANIVAEIPISESSSAPPKVDSNPSSIAWLTEKLTKPLQPTPEPEDDSSSRSSSSKMSPPSTKNSSSEFSLSTSEASSSSVPSTTRTPFFEKYAQLMPNTKKTQFNTAKTQSNTTKTQSKSSPKVVDPKTRPKLSSRKNLSPITSPEPSPRAKNQEVSHSSKETLPTSKPAPFSNLPEFGLASQRREAANRRLRQETNLTTASASSGLDKLLTAEQDYSSRSTSDTTRQNSRAVVPEQKAASRTLMKDRLNDHPTASGLEDLMGDLMAEMEKKAELTSEEYKNTISRRAPSRPGILVPEVSIGRSTQGQKPEGTTTRRNQADPNNTPKSYSRPPTASDQSPTPSSPGIKPSDSISQLGYARSPSPKLVRGLNLPVQHSGKACQRCGASPIRHVKNPTTDEARFCRQCYAELYLPKCRKCSQPIERGAVTDRVGKVLGKYHSDCFNCFQCSAPFPDGEFYVWERKPICFKHYHRLAGTICCNEGCGQGIEGPCISLLLEGSSVGSVTSDDSSQSNPISNSSRRKLYHPEHFTCSRRGCPNSLHEFHFVVNGHPWCEKHALQEEDHLSRMMRPNRLPPPRDPKVPYGRGPPLQPPDRTRRVERRRTIIQNVRNR